MRTISIFTLLVACLLSLSSCDKVSKADNLCLDNKFEEAAKLYEEAAAEGNAYAKWKLADAYYNANGVELDYEKAKKLLEEAAKEGCEEAKCDIARSYMLGFNNYNKDVEKGKKMFLELVNKSENDYVISSYARELLHGWNFEEDKDKAEKLLKSVKDKNNHLYLRTMGELYMKGSDKTDINYTKALEFFEEAYAKGSRFCAYEIADLYNGNSEIDSDIEKSIDWLKKGIERNSSECMVTLGDIYISEDSTFFKYHDINKGLDLYKKATKHGSGVAYTKLGTAYHMGNIIEKDDDKAFEYLKKAYELKEPQGAYNYGFRYVEGIGTEINLKKGIEIWEKAVEYGSGAAANNLYCYYYGIAYDSKLKDLELAKKYLLEAAKLNDGMGCSNLASHYYNGSDMVKENKSEAYIYYKKAADLGNIDACGYVSYMYANGIGCQKNPEKAKEYENKTKAKEDVAKDN